MASVPITSWQINGETAKTMGDFILRRGVGCSKITADGDCSHEIKTYAPWKESYDKPRQHIKKQRYYFANKGLFGQSYVFFPVVMYGCESWTIKKAETKELMLLNCGVGGLLRVLWTARRSNQSILKISPGISLEGMMLKLKLQYFGHLM